MKKFKLIVILILGLIGMEASAESMLDGITWQYDNKIWDDAHGISYDELVSTTILKAEGDTIVGGETYKKIYERTYRHSPRILLKNGNRPSLFTLVREDDGKIYFIENEGDTEGKLIFDFNLEEGEEVEAWTFRSLDETLPSDKYRMVGLEKTTFLSSGITYPAIRVAKYDIPSGMFVYDEYWVYGIGKPIGCMFGWDFSFGGSTPAKTIYSADGEIIYFTEDVINDERFNGTGVEGVNVADTQEETYGVNGLRLRENSKGIHVSRGKKIMN